MKFSIYYNYGALNSRPVFDAVAQGLERIGHTVCIHDDSADVAIIWSQLWAGRMKSNKTVWDHYRGSNRPVIVVEVGALKRETTWRLMLNGKNAFTSVNNSCTRFNQLGLTLHPWRRGGQHIVIACQRPESQQWAGMPTLNEWVASTVKKIKLYSDRTIYIRPHPRHKLLNIPTGCLIDQPQLTPNTYDDFDFARSLQSAWCVVNHNSNPAVQSILAGIPAFVDTSSVAAPVASTDIMSIESPLLPDREQWAWDLAHTEWTVAEIAQGTALESMLSIPIQ